MAIGSFWGAIPYITIKKLLPKKAIVPIWGVKWPQKCPTSIIYRKLK